MFCDEREEYKEMICLIEMDEKMTYSMEGFGLFDSKVCKDCGISYNHGPGTMTLSWYFLLE